MMVVTPSPASASLHQVSTDSIVVVCSSLVECLLQPSVLPIAILGYQHLSWCALHVG